MEDAKTAGQHLVDEFMAKQAARPVKATYDYATWGSKTRMGGEIVTASTGITIHEHRVACVGDWVRYSDGTETEIVSGAGFAVAFKGRPIAIVGSTTDNGDTVTRSLQSDVLITEYADGEGIPGLLQPGHLIGSQM